MRAEIPGRQTFQRHTGPAKEAGIEDFCALRRGVLCETEKKKDRKENSTCLVGTAPRRDCYNKALAFVRVQGCIGKKY